MTKFIALALSLIIMTGCSFRLPTVYKMNVPQGNIVKQDMLDQLKPGLTKRQVRFIMGTPMVADTFNDQRWDYVFFVKKGEGTYREEHIVIHFEEDKLKEVVGELKFSKKDEPTDPTANPVVAAPTE